MTLRHSASRSSPPPPRRTQLARDGGERLFLPDDVVAILTELRALGVSERTVQLERDTWIVVAALSPDLVAEWARVKRWAMEDPEFRAIYLAAAGVAGPPPLDGRKNPSFSGGTPVSRLANCALPNTRSF